MIHMKFLAYRFAVAGLDLCKENFVFLLTKW